MTTLAANSSGLATRSLPPAITTDASSFEAAARAAERVEVVLPGPGAEHRSRLMAFVLASIEAQLERLGAAPAGYGPRDSLETSLSDQLYRSRLLGAGGIALRFTSLEGIADTAGGLSVEDSHALRRMFAFAELEPLQILLPEQSAQLCVAGAPQRLREWLPLASLAGRVAHIEYDAVSSSGDAASCEPNSGEPVSSSPSSTPPASYATDTALAPPDVAAFIDAGSSTAPAELPVRYPAAAEAAAEPASSHGEPAASHGEPAASHGEPASPEPANTAPADSSAAVPASSDLPPRSSELAAGGAPGSAEQRAELQRRCASWLAQLRSMNGPKQHASVERAFMTAYVPLMREVASGYAPEELRAAVDSWAEGFAQSYAAAFKTLNGHARRPTMVRDIFDVVLRWLNQYRARSCELLLVDCMRFDLGQRLNEELEQRLAGQAVCRDQALLWAALPSNSVAQRLAETGSASALRPRPAQPGKPAEPEARSGIQPLRVGTRELFRLDRLAAELAKPGEVESRRIERMARSLADEIEPWLKSQAPDTMVVIFGDHGFHWQANERGTGAAQRGGALPEQVLVPASAWLLRSPRSRAGIAPGLH